MEQQSPPSYAMLLSSPEMMEDDAEMFADDVQRLKQMPEELRQELRDYISTLLSGHQRDDQACIWLERDTMQCRYHEHRPSICREFEMGSEDCRGWRTQYKIDSRNENTN